MSEALNGAKHPFLVNQKSASFVRDLKLNGLPLRIDALAKRPNALRGLGEEARVLLGCAMVLDPDGPEGSQWLRLLARAYTLQAARLLPGDGPVALDLPVLGRVAVPRTDEIRSLFLRQYIDACHAALALGDEQALALLGAVPPERLEGMDGKPHSLLQARGLRHYARGEMRPAAVLALEAAKACNSPALSGGERDFALMITSPEVELGTFWGDPAPQWEARLHTALDLHRRFLVANGPAGAPPAADAYVALGPLAFSALRYAAGLPGGVVAPELPPALVERRHAG